MDDLKLSDYHEITNGKISWFKYIFKKQYEY